ncbi:MAG TPA: Gfo/Idh/MocA family oxidoreductase [Planctomycetes bacterium]|nr:Gfo/Idh/MocA family oxidoreductase [Planctomycetota bacterium]HIK82207.1 Gfo/Idh/MocA family oxidoreductase [Planctomycetota bacterium]
METDRRDFLIQGAGALAGMALLPGLEAMATRAPKGYPVAIIGMGRQGRAIAAELQKLGATIVAICDVDEPRLRSARRRVADATAYADSDQLLAKEQGVEAIFIATPTHQHRAIAEAAVAAGKHVYCEAPLAHTLEDARAIALAARSHPRVFQVGLLARSNPVYSLARSFFRTEAFLKLVSMRAQNSRKTSWRQAASTAERQARLDWRLDPTVSLGLPGEWGTHQFDVIHWFTGQYPHRVSGNGGVFVWEDGRKVADTVNLTLEFPKGQSLQYQATLGNSYGGRYEILHGVNSAFKLAWSHGWMFKEADAATQGWEVYANRQRFFNDEGITLIADATKLASQNKLKDGVGLPNDSLHYGVADFLLSCAEQMKVKTGVSEGLRATAVGIAAQRAVVEGGVIEISQDDLKED